MLNDHIHFGGGGDAVFQLERQIFEQAGHQVYTYSMSPDAQVKPSAHDIIFQEPASYLQRRLGKFVIMPKLVQHLRDVLLACSLILLSCIYWPSIQPKSMRH